jgi:hypothetical protein
VEKDEREVWCWMGVGGQKMRKRIDAKGLKMEMLVKEEGEIRNPS